MISETLFTHFMQVIYGLSIVWFMRPANPFLCLGPHSTGSVLWCPGDRDCASSSVKSSFHRIPNYLKQKYPSGTNYLQRHTTNKRESEPRLPQLLPERMQYKTKTRKGGGTIKKKLKKSSQSFSYV